MAQGRKEILPALSPSAPRLIRPHIYPFGQVQSRLCKPGDKAIGQRRGKENTANQDDECTISLIEFYVFESLYFQCEKNICHRNPGKKLGGELFR